MIKGAQKQMIVVRTGGSRYFDEAYFVLRRDVRPQHGQSGDLLSEADRILRENETAHLPRHRKSLPRGLWLFGLGILLGAGTAVLICLLC